MSGYEIYGVIIAVMVTCGVLYLMWQVGKSAWRER